MLDASGQLQRYEVDGGAVTIDMHHEAWFPVVFAVAFGLLIWGALILRLPALLKVLIAGDE